MRIRVKRSCLFSLIIVLIFVVFQHHTFDRTVSIDRDNLEKYFQSNYLNEAVLEDIFVERNYCVAVFSVNGIRGNGTIVLKQHWFFPNRYNVIQFGESSQSPCLDIISNGIGSSNMVSVSGYRGTYERYIVHICYQDRDCEEQIIPIVKDIFCDMYFLTDDYEWLSVEYQ